MFSRRSIMAKERDGQEGNAVIILLIVLVGLFFIFQSKRDLEMIKSNEKTKKAAVVNEGDTFHGYPLLKTDPDGTKYYGNPGYAPIHKVHPPGYSPGQSNENGNESSSGRNLHNNEQLVMRQYTTLITHLEPIIWNMFKSMGEPMSNFEHELVMTGTDSSPAIAKLTWDGTVGGGALTSKTICFLIYTKGQWGCNGYGTKVYRADGNYDEQSTLRFASTFEAGEAWMQSEIQKFNRDHWGYSYQE